MTIIKQVGILGGTFNPIHNAHIQMALDAKSEFNLDEVILLLSPLPPHKQQNSITNKIHRFEMVKLAANEHSLNFSDVEMNREGTTYTIDTLKILKEQNKDCEFFYIIGSDTLKDLKNWKSIDQVLKLTKFICFCRDNSTIADNIEYINNNFNDDKQQILFSSTVQQPISSTFIRDELKKENNISPLVSHSVYEYILQYALYSKDFEVYDSIRKQVETMINQKRMQHTLNVVYSAILLAQRFNKNVSDSRFAALLHDCAKDIPFGESIKMLNRWDIDPTDYYEFPKTLHAAVGAQIAKYQFHMDENIVNAIYVHTTGAKEMNSLDKIIYLADVIEKNRSFKGVEKLRQLAENSLEDAFFAALNRKIIHLIEEDKKICLKSVQARNNMIDKRKR